MSTISSENNFNYLFIALVSLLFSMAIFRYIESTWLSNLIEILFVATLLLGVHSLKSERSWMWAVYIMTSILFIIFISKQFLHNQTLIDVTHLIILLTFFISSFFLSFKQILMSKEITQNMIIGSVVLFLLLGVIWSTLYLLLLIVFPDGFNGLEALSWKENFSQVTYFSFVTLTTLGYGDISPKNSITRFFVYSEAIVGVFYMAIIVSSLVSARLSHKENH